MSRSWRADPGFTLIELMVVVLIIGILVSIAVPVFGTARHIAEANSCQADQREIVGCMQVYRSDMGAVPADPAGTLAAGGSPWYPILVSNYLLNHPMCPSDHSLYLVDASGELAGDNGLTTGFKPDHQAP